MSAAVDPCTEQASPARCRAHVESCTACGWSGHNAPERPCVKCGGEVVRRPCKNWPMHGSAVCVKHGGRAPQVRTAGRRRLADRKMRQSLAAVDVEPIVDVHEAFAQLVAEAVALKDAWAGHVAHLEQLRYEGAQGSEQLRSEVVLYERAMDRAGRLLAEWVRLGLEERRVVVETAKVKLMAEALRQALTDAGVNEPKPIIEAFAVRLVELEKANGEGGK